MRSAVAEDTPRRAQRVAIGFGVIGKSVEIGLYALRRVQTPQRGELARRQSVHELEQFRRAVLPREVVERRADRPRIPDRFLPQRLFLGGVMERGVRGGLREELDLRRALQHDRGVARLGDGGSGYHDAVVAQEERMRLAKGTRDRLALCGRAD